MTKWRDLDHEWPPEGVVVQTKIEDEYGIRFKGEMSYSEEAEAWFRPNGKKLFWQPTHWRFERDDWVEVEKRKPPNMVAVETKFPVGDEVADPKAGHQMLRYTRAGNLWFFSDRDVPVYCSPTHWRYV